MQIIKDTYPLLYAFQKEGVDFLANARSALLSDGVGCMKTAQAIHACQQVGARNILVICPPSIMENWKKEAIKWGYDGKDIHIIDSENINDFTSLHIGMFIITYDICWRKRYAKKLLKQKFDVLIGDEIHRAKNHNTRRAKAIWLKRGYVDISIYRWMLTATPVLNYPVELHTMLHKLCPERLGEYKNYIAYTKRYCDGHPGKWGYEATGAINLDELAGRLEGFMLRRTRDEVMPAKTLQKIYLPFNEEIEHYLFTGRENDSIRHKIGLSKVAPSAEHIMKLLESETKIVVFAYHTLVIKDLEDKLASYNPVVLDGAVPKKKRQSIIDEFIEDPKCRVFIGQIQAAGEGIDGLQHAASVGVFVEIVHTPGTIKQAIGRLHREGQKHSCLFQFLLVEGTVDEKILNGTIFKDENIKTIMKDKELGLDFSNPIKQKEDIMSMEDELKRVADALEELVSFKKTEHPVNTVETVCGNDTASISGEDITICPPVAEPTKKPVRKSSGRPKKVEATVKKVPVVKKEREIVMLSSEEYQTKMHEVANQISEFSGDPAKTNTLFAKLQEKFKVHFPKNEHVFDVEAKDYTAVCKLVEEFLITKGVK